MSESVTLKLSRDEFRTLRLFGQVLKARGLIKSDNPSEIFRWMMHFCFNFMTLQIKKERGY